MSISLYKATAVEAVEQIIWAPVDGKITIRDGREIDVTGRYWTIPTAVKKFSIDWGILNVPEGNLRNAIRRWIAHLLQTQNPTVGQAAFRQASWLFHAPAFLKAAQDAKEVPYLAFSQAQAALSDDQRWQLHYARLFYRWCESQRFPYFSREVVRKLDLIVVGGNEKGRVVRSLDPDQGPLDAIEVANLALALRAARMRGDVPLEEQAAVWLALAFGANASQYAAMREEDIKPQFRHNQLGTTLINVPRHKKGHLELRVEFQTRKANRFVGRLLIELVEENKRKHPSDDPHIARPLFRRRKPLDRGTGLEEWAWHLQAEEFTLLLKRAVKRLRVMSRAGTPLHISARRLRYSMATRMVQEGASKYTVAAALDHSDLQNVDTYFDVHSGIVDHIDRALALVLGARASAFSTLVSRDNQGENARQSR